MLCEWNSLYAFERAAKVYGYESDTFSLTPNLSVPRRAVSPYPAIRVLSLIPSRLTDLLTVGSDKSDPWVQMLRCQVALAMPQTYRIRDNVLERERERERERETWVEVWVCAPVKSMW